MPSFGIAVMTVDLMRNLSENMAVDDRGVFLTLLIYLHRLLPRVPAAQFFFVIDIECRAPSLKRGPVTSITIFDKWVHVSRSSGHYSRPPFPRKTANVASHFLNHRICWAIIIDHWGASLLMAFFFLQQEFGKFPILDQHGQHEVPIPRYGRQPNVVDV